MIDLIILASLLDGPKHGYALKKQAGMIFNHSQLHNNLVYPLLRRFTSEDLKDMVVDGEVWVTCEFCNSRYRFDPASFSKPDED